MSFRGGDKETLLGSSSTQGGYYPESVVPVSSPQYTPPSGPLANRGSQEVDIISGVRCIINWQVDGMSVRTKLVKCQVFSGSTVGALASTIQEQWDVNINAARIVGGEVRFIDYIVSECGAVVLPEYPAALLFPDKSSNTASIEIVYIFERKEKPCCPGYSSNAKGLGFVVSAVRFIGGMWCSFLLCVVFSR